MANVANLKALEKGLSFFGQVEAVPGANQFTIGRLGNMGTTSFVGWTAYVLWDAGGGAAAPQAESKLVTVYTNAGVFTTAAFTAAVAAGDYILLLHPSVAAGSAAALEATAQSIKAVTDALPDAGALTSIAQASVVGALNDAAATGAVTDVDTLMAYIKQLVTETPKLFQKSITSAANTNGLVTIATITTAACLIKSIVVKAVTAAQTDLTSAAVKGGASQVVTFLSATDAAVANITSIDQQVAWTGAVELAATKTIVMDVQGTGATPVNLLVTIEYQPVTNGTLA